MLHEIGQSLWLDNITRDLLDRGTLQALHRRAVGHGTHVQSDDFRSCHQEQHGLRRGDPPQGQGGQGGRAPVLRAGSGGSHPGRRSLPADLGPDRRRGRLGVAGGLAAARPRHREHPRRGARSPRAGGTSQPAHQDSRYQRGAARDRGGDLLRHPDQRHAPVLPGAVRRGGRGLHAGDRATHSGRAQSQRGLGGLGLRQPLGRRGGGQGAAPRSTTSWGSRSPSAPTRRRAICSARRAGAEPTTPGPARSVRSGPAPGRRIRRLPTCSM